MTNRKAEAIIGKAIKNLPPEARPAMDVDAALIAAAARVQRQKPTGLGARYAAAAVAVLLLLVAFDRAPVLADSLFSRIVQWFRGYSLTLTESKKSGASRMLEDLDIGEKLTFDSIAEAEDAIGMPLIQPGYLPPTLRFSGMTCSHNDDTSLLLELTYEDGGKLNLIIRYQYVQYANSSIAMERSATSDSSASSTRGEGEGKLALSIQGTEPLLMASHASPKVSLYISSSLPVAEFQKVLDNMHWIPELLDGN